MGKTGWCQIGLAAFDSKADPRRWAVTPEGEWRIVRLLLA